jgi:hypothetical protein
VVPTYPLFNGAAVLAWWRGRCFFGPKSESKDGKQPRYFSVVEYRRAAQNHAVQRRVLYPSFSRPPETLISGLSAVWSPAPPPDITTVATGQVPLAGLTDLHPLERQLASLQPRNGLLARNNFRLMAGHRA